MSIDNSIVYLISRKKKELGKTTHHFPTKVIDAADESFAKKKVGPLTVGWIL